MDIEAISGPKLSQSIKRPFKREGIIPVEQIDHLSIIDDGRPYEPPGIWSIEDRVTISARARRKYNEMLAR